MRAGRAQPGEPGEELTPGIIPAQFLSEGHPKPWIILRTRPGPCSPWKSASSRMDSPRGDTGKQQEVFEQWHSAADSPERSSHGIPLWIRLWRLGSNRDQGMGQLPVPEAAPRGGHPHLPHAWNTLDLHQHLVLNPEPQPSKFQR